jgi:TPR repeat protein
MDPGNSSLRDSDWRTNIRFSRRRNRRPTRFKISLAAGRPVEPANLEQLRELAARGDPTAENALGLLYAQGDEKQAIKPDDREAAAWFTKAAEHGSVSCPIQIGPALLGWHHGLPQGSEQSLLLDGAGPRRRPGSSKDLAKVLASGMTRAQAATIEQQAEIWYRQHESHSNQVPAARKPPITLSS